MRKKNQAISTKADDDLDQLTPVLAPWRRATNLELLGAACKQVIHFCTQISGRSLTIFVEQLTTGLWWETAKVLAPEQFPKRPGVRKAAPVQSLYDHCRAQNPHLPASRTLNAWGEALLLGAQNEGWIVLPPRQARQKQPRPAGVKRLGQISPAQIHLLARKHHNLTRLRQALRPETRSPLSSGADSPESVRKLLKRTTDAIRFKQATADCIPLLRQLASIAAAAAERLSNRTVPVRNGKQQQIAAARIKRGK